MESLPVEVIAHIMHFLKHGDQMSFALTAKKNYEGYCDPKVAKNVLLRFDYCQLDLLCAPLSIFNQSCYKYQRLVLGAGVKGIGKETSCYIGFWKRFGNCIKELVIETPGELGFLLVAKYMPNIRTLRMINRGTRSIYFKKEYITALKDNLKNVIFLEVCSNFEQLEELLEILPSLETISLEGFSCKQQRTFNRNNSLSLDFLIQYITKVRALELKGLLLHSYCIELNSNEKFFYKLANITGLLLQKLACSIEGVPILLLHQLFSNMQNSLKSLDITSWAGISSEIYSLIFNYLKDLEQLTLRGKLTTSGLLQICELKHLKALKVKDTFEEFESQQLSHFLGRLKQCLRLEELQVDTKCLNSNNCTTCFHSFASNHLIPKHLTSLDISRSNIDNHNLKLLIHSFKNLKELYMNDCKNITQFECLKINGTNEANISSHVLQQLQVLELNYCINLTLDGLLNLFYLPDIRKLSLNNLEVFSEPLVEIISNHCPSLEKLNVANCHQLNDASIEMIAVRLKRLQYLNISGCKRLTKLTEYSLWKCVRLKTLYAVGMDRLNISVIILFAKIDALQVYRCKEDYTRVEFESGKYMTTAQKKLQMVRYLLFANNVK